MTHKNKLIIAGVLILLVLGIVGFMKFGRQGKIAEKASVIEEDIPTKENSEFSKGTIQGLLTSGKDVTCTMNYPDKNGSGTVYVSGNKFRGDFNVKVEDKQMTSHMIQDNGIAYMWTDGTNQGTSFKLDAVKPSTLPSGQAQTADLNKQSFPTDKEVDLRCTPGSGDASQFTTPADVKFTDMSAMMKNAVGASGAGQMTKMDKSICDAITDATAKTQCQKSLGN